jgi:glucose-1-phosphate thymidylyltransferase
MKASQFIYTVEERQGIKISCPEEIAYNNKWVLRETIEKNIKGLSGNYVDYIKNMISS